MQQRGVVKLTVSLRNQGGTVFLVCDNSQNKNMLQRVGCAIPLYIDIQPPSPRTDQPLSHLLST